jgi:hypothetical protein
MTMAGTVKVQTGAGNATSMTFVTVADRPRLPDPLITGSETMCHFPGKLV